MWGKFQEVLIERVAPQVISGFLGNYSITELRWAVDNNFDLLKAFRENNVQAFKFVQSISHEYSDKSDIFSVTSILGLIEKSRPDLVNEIRNSPKTRAWFDQQLYNFKMALFNGGNTNGFGAQAT